MKQLVLTLLLLLLFTSCLEEGLDGCPGYMRFTFLYDETAEGYDSKIANDIHLRIYKDDVLYSAGIIPYEKIKNGGEYLLKKEVKGEIDIVAWAVPSGSDFVSKIPTPSEDALRTGELLTMEPIHTSMYRSLGHLFLGTFTHEEEDLTCDTNYPVSLNDCIAEFTAAIHNIPELYDPSSDEVVWMEVYGTKSQMDTDFRPRGEDAVVMVEFSESAEEGILRTERHGLLPSAEDQFISVDIYRSDRYQGRVRTDLQASPGDNIHLDIYRNTVTIYINGWRVFSEAVEWI